MPEFRYDQRGVSNSLEFSPNGGQIVWDGTKFLSTTDGSTFAQFAVPLNPVDNQDAASKFYVDSQLGPGGSGPYDVVSFAPDTPFSNEVLFDIVFTRTVTFEDNFNSSRGNVVVNPSSNFVIDVQRNSSSIGSVIINTSGVFTFSTIASTIETFNAGDILTLQAPATTDLTIAGISITLSGTF